MFSNIIPFYPYSTYIIPLFSFQLNFFFLLMLAVKLTKKFVTSFWYIAVCWLKQSIKTELKTLSYFVGNNKF